MELISNYLKTVLQDLLQESKQNPAFFLIILVLLCLPLGHAVSSVALMLLTITTIITFKKKNFTIQFKLILPVLLFTLMAFSLLWTNDWSASVRALQKEIPLILVPICFLILPGFSIIQKKKIVGYYSIGMVFYTIFWIIKACIRYFITGNSEVFFYHELVTEDLNAIHVSAYISIAIFYFLTKNGRNLFDKISIILLSSFLILLSSKNVMIIFLLLSIFYLTMVYKSAQKRKIVKWIFAFGILAGVVFMGKLKDRFMIELESNTAAKTINREISTENGLVYNVTVKQAWTQDKFAGNDYFPGAAFRVYQIRIFCEMLAEDPVFFTGYGLNAVDFKIREKGAEHNVFAGNEHFDGYQNKNFHNQYIQLFAEIGIFGLLILIAMLFFNLNSALLTKDFVHISFGILMISLFLTESFLSRQRGIIFFIIFYCLFTSDTMVLNPKLKTEL